LKVTVIKGPHFEERKAQAQELIYRIISKEVSKENERKGA
jgi:hypothetical protein